MEKEFCYLRKDCWNCIIDYLDINSMLQLELTSKNFKIQIDYYYEFISKYFNFVLNCSLKGKEFYNDINENEKNNDIQFSQKGIVPKSEIIFFGNK